MIVARLRQLAQLRTRLSGQRAALATAVVILAAFLLVASLDVWIGLPWVVRLGALCAIAVGGAITFRSRAHRLAESEAARLVEAAHPELGQSVRTAAQIAPSLDRTRPAIEAALVEQTARRMAPLPLDEELASRRTLAPVAFAAAALALAWIVAVSVSTDWRAAAGRALGLPITFTGVKAAAFPERLKADEAVRIVATVSGRRTSQAILHLRNEGEGWHEQPLTPVAPQQFDVMLSGLAKPLEYYVSSGDGRSRVSRIAVHIAPKLQHIAARLEYPSYLGLAPTEQTGGDFEGVEGTKARVELEFDRPVADARVVFSDGATTPIAIERTGGRAEILLPPDERTWRVAGHDPSGVEFETPPHRLKGSADKPPVIKLAEPRDEVEVTPLQELIARVQAKDDYGLASVGIVLQIGTNTETLLEKKFEALDVRQTAEMAVAFLEKHALTINDSLLVYAYATDHKPRDGARVVSPLAAVDIREFKRLWRLAGKESKECQCQNLVEKMITLQRRIYSDTTQLKELSGNQAVPKALVLPLAGRERKVDEIAHELETLLAEFLDPEMRAFQEAAAEIVERLHAAVASLQAIRLPESCVTENAALTVMLELRRQMIYKFGKKSSNARMTESKPSPDQGERPTLTQLAEQLEGAAKEEESVAAQTQALAPAAETPAALRRQQEAATGDVGEVLTELDTHPAATDMARERGTQAEAWMNAAAKALSGTRAQAAPALTESEAALRELAAHLRLLDQPPDETTLAKLEQRAEKAAECLVGCAKCAKAGAGKSTSSGTGGKMGEGTGKGETPAGKAGETAPHGETPADFSEKIAVLAEQAVTLDDALRKWSSGEGDAPPSPTGKALGRLAEAQRTAKVGEELRALARSLATSRGGENPDAAAKAEALAQRQQQIAAALRQERDALRQTRAQQLTQLRQRVQGVSADNFIGVATPTGAIEPSGATKQRLVRSLPTAEGAEIFAALRATGDRDLDQWARSIEENAKRPGLAWRALRSADARLATLLAELKRTAPIAIRESTVPDQYRRVVENYFRALSDDFGSDENEAAAEKK